MDYIQEELRRQREALARLLLGGTASGEEAEDRRKRDAEGLPAVSAEREAVELDRVFPAAGGISPEEASLWGIGRFLEVFGPGMGRRFDRGGGDGPLPLPAEAGEAASAVYQRWAAAEDVSDVYRRLAAEVGPAAALAAGGDDAVEVLERNGRFLYRESGGLRRQRIAEEAAGLDSSRQADPGGGTAMEVLERNGRSLYRESGGLRRRVAEEAAGLDPSRQADPGGGGPGTAGAVFSPEGGETVFRNVIEAVYPVGGTGGSVKDLSRAFERDARRYDGAFEMF